MRKVAVVLCIALVAFSFGCHKKKKKDKLKTSITPNGGTFFPDTTINFTIKANRQNVTIHYRIGGSDWSSDSAPVSGSVTGGDGEDVVVEWYAEQIDPNTNEVIATDGSESSPHSATFHFRDNPPNVNINPASGDYSERMTISISASDDDPSGTLTLEYQTSEDGQNWSPTETVTGSQYISTTVDWTDGYQFHVKARATDSSGQQTSWVQRDYYLEIDFDKLCHELLDIINTERDKNGLNPLTWNGAFASACKEHAEQLYLGNAPDAMPTTPGADGKVIFNSQGNNYPTRAKFNMSVFGTGVKGSQYGDAQSVANILVQNMSQYFLDSSYTDFGAGCYFDPRGSNPDWYWVILLGK